MAQRKNESFHAEIEALFESQIESVDNQIAATSDNNTDSNHPDENQNPYETLEAAERLLDSNRTKEAFGLMHAALRKFLQQTCTNKEIATDKNDSISILQAKIIDHIKQQNNANLTDTSCSMLRTATLMTETIGDISHQYRDEEHFNNADIKYAINITRSVMIYIDELIS